MSFSTENFEFFTPDEMQGWPKGTPESMMADPGKRKSEDAYQPGRGAVLIARAKPLRDAPPVGIVCLYNFNPGDGSVYVGTVESTDLAASLAALREVLRVMAQRGLAHNDRTPILPRGKIARWTTAVPSANFREPVGKTVTAWPRIKQIFSGHRIGAILDVTEQRTVNVRVERVSDEREDGTVICEMAVEASEEYKRPEPITPDPKPVRGG